MQTKTKTKPAKDYRFSLRHARRFGTMPPPSVMTRETLQEAKRLVKSPSLDHELRVMLQGVWGLHSTKVTSLLSRRPE